MNKLSQLYKYWWILLIGIFLMGIYFTYAGTFGDGITFNSVNLSGTDTGEWIGAYAINSMDYDNVTSRLYLSTTNAQIKTFGWFDYKQNVTIAYNTSSLDNILFSRDVNGQKIVEVKHSYTLNRTFAVTERTTDGLPIILWYSSNNVTVNVSTNNCGATTSVLDAELSVNKTGRAERLYVVNGGLYYFDTQLNYTVCLTSANGNDPVGILGTRDISYDFVHNWTWLGSSVTSFGFFNEDRNITMNMSDKLSIPNNKLTGSIDEVKFDSFNNLVWLAFRNNTNTHPRLFYFNITSNSTVTEVNTNDVAQLFNMTSSGTTIVSLEINQRDNTLLIGLDSGQSLQGGVYGYFDLKSNRTYALNGSDINNWVGDGNSISKLYYDISRNNTYLSAGVNVFGVFGTDDLITNSAPTIINNYTNPITPTLNNPFNITAEINGTEIDDLIYANFSIQASNGTILLNNVNGTLTRNGNIFNYTSSTFIADDGGTWRWNYTTRDNASSTEVFRSGQFTISDSTAPTLNITHLFNRLNPNNTNFSIDTTYRIQVNWTGTDNIRLNTMWYIFDNNATNTTIPLYTNFTITVPFAGRHNITLFANDTTGNIGSTFINFSVRNDTQIPSITITAPSSGGTQTSQTITTNHSLSDNVEIYLARYSVYSGSTQNIANRTITNPSTNTTLIYTTTLGCSSTSYTLYLWANDTSGNEQQTSSVYTCTTSSPAPSGGGGGGGGSTLCRNSGDVCTSDSDCCGGNLCSKETGTCIGLPILFKSGEISILMSNERSTSDSYDIRLLKGKSATRIIKFENNGTRTARLDLSCDDENDEGIETDVCNWVTLEQNSVTLLKDEKKEIKFTIQVPESVEYGEVYLFGIRAKNDQLGFDEMLRSEVHIDPIIGFLFSLGEKISGSQIIGEKIAESREGAKPLFVKNWIILFLSLIILSLVSYFILKLVKKTLIGKGWISFAVGLILTILVLIFI